MSSPNYVVSNYTANTVVEGKGYAMIYPTPGGSVTITVDNLQNITHSRADRSYAGDFYVSDSYYHNNQKVTTWTLYSRTSCEPYKVEFMINFKCTGNMSALIYLEQQETTTE